MRVGIGLTVLARGIKNGHIDGIGIYALELMRALQAEMVDLTGVTFGDFPLEGIGPVKGAVGVPGYFNLAAALSSVFGVPHAGGRSLRGYFDLFHATDHHIPLLRFVPVVATVMDAIPLAHPEWVSHRLRRFKNFAFRQSVRSADRIITISMHSRHDIVEYFGVPENRIDVIPLGVDERFFAEPAENAVENVLARHKVRKGGLVFVGTIQPRKNLRRLIEAHRCLGSSVRKEHPLIVVGKYGWGDDGLRALMIREQERGYLHWLQDVTNNELPVLLRSSLAMVYPSLYEGFGLPLLEAFASRIPVISSNTTSIPEVAGDAALLVNPVSVEEIAAAIEMLVNDDALRRCLVGRGRILAANYTWRRCAQLTLMSYQKAVA